MSKRNELAVSFKMLTFHCTCMLTFSIKLAMLFLLFNSINGRYKVTATGTPLVGHGGSLAQACKIRIARECRVAQFGHSIISRRGASRI